MRRIPLIVIWALACDDGAEQPRAVDATPDERVRGMVDWGPDAGAAPDVAALLDAGAVRDGADPDVRLDADPRDVPDGLADALALDAAPDAGAPDLAPPDGAAEDAAVDALVPDMSAECVDDLACPIDARCEDGVCVPVPPAATCEDPIWLNAFDERRGVLPEREDGLISACHDFFGSPEVVFAVRLPEFEGTVCATTAGSDFDTVLHVRVGDCRESAAEIRCSNDIGGQQQAQMDFYAEPDETYFLILDGLDERAAGAYRLEFFFGPCLDLGCEFDMDCMPDEVCRAGVCEALDERCLDDDQCPPGRRCVVGECRDVGLPCQDDRDCIGDQVCVDRICFGDPDRED